MRKTRNILMEGVKCLLMMLALVMPLCACSDDDEYEGLTEETKALRKKYNEKIVGDWTYELRNDRIRYYSQINLDKNGNYTETEKTARPRIDVYGHITWEVDHEGTNTGTWYLEYVESDKRNTLNVVMDGMTLTRYFYGIHDGQMLLSTPFLAGQAAYERGKKEPSF